MQRFIRKIFTTFYKIFNLSPSSYPYISGDSFKSIASFVFQSNTRNSLDKLKRLSNKSIVFMQTNQVEEFMSLRKLVPDKKFKLILHNSDAEFNYELYSKVNLFNDWFFTQNCNVISSNVTPIPIGLENRVFHLNGIVSRYKKLEKNQPNLPLIFYSFSVNTNIKIRSKSIQYLKNSNVSVNYHRMENSEYLKIMSNHMFCFSPPGNGIDCHRTWESIAINVVPICFKSPLIDHFVNLGLPIWAINKLEDLDHYQESDKLKEKYFEIQSKSLKSGSYINYWKNIILNSIQ